MTWQECFGWNEGLGGAAGTDMQDVTDQNKSKDLGLALKL